MERPLELFAILAFVALIAFGLLARNPGSQRRQAIVGFAIGGASALVIATQETDLVPDGLEILVAIAAVVAGAILLVVVRRAARAPNA